MSVRRSRGTNSAPSTRKKPGTPADQMREMARSLRQHADFLDACARRYAELKSPVIRILPGNFYLALSHVREFYTKQILTKMLNNSAGSGKRVHEIFGELFRLQGELEDSVPKRAARRRDA